MKENNKSDLREFYPFVYECSCGNEYGSDKEEKGKHKCPKCEGTFK